MTKTETPADPTDARAPGPLGRRWENTPLRVRLVAAVLLLVTGALVLMSVANVNSLQEYLIDRVDEDLRQRLDSRNAAIMIDTPGTSSQMLYTEFVVYQAVGNDLGVYDTHFAVEEMPLLTAEDLYAMADVPRTMPSADGKLRWRVLSTVIDPHISDGQRVALAIATPMDEVDTTVARLIWIDLLVGAAVLAGLAALGVALVRASLNPLKEIEHTASAIAAGDLSLRVPRRGPDTEVGRLSAALNVMLGQIETALEAREASEERALASEERMRRFVADASHELRTPLTTVRGFSELYRQRGDVPPEEAAELMRRIEAEAIRMGLLVEDLLLLARLDQQRPFEWHQVDLLSVAADTVSAAQLVADGRTIDLYTEGGPFLVRGDDLRLRQVLSNLVTNAIRHTPTGSHVEVRLRSDGDYVDMVVTDDGPGMSQEQVERVFERFYRADKARSRQAGGTGLGLAIVAALVAAHGGEVSARSSPGEGAEFTVRLRLDPDVRSGDDGPGEEPEGGSP
ncbi:two-component system OmpR family sensor kinase [Stackebrandtia albiflava]|uniref:histidine kinase n=1 Tax=Stackebrandtia albiflava TaxID=406432 RepID=A0A562V5M3_9ACTN|nr:HAMP domain-containing sensor histidine kinase [Stackebrandtia albiflava]TWJ13057.1 two-component system OmpR family sensor kinase [Stackebrandtia albiflava]